MTSESIRSNKHGYLIDIMIRSWMHWSTSQENRMRPVTKFTQSHNGEGEQSRALAVVENTYLLAAIKEYALIVLK